jgi:hypothetical protein
MTALAMLTTAPLSSRLPPPYPLPGGRRMRNAGRAVIAALGALLCYLAVASHGSSKHNPAPGSGADRGLLEAQQVVTDADPRGSLERCLTSKWGADHREKVFLFIGTPLRCCASGPALLSTFLSALLPAGGRASRSSHPLMLSQPSARHGNLDARRQVCRD